jgi:hypothetical protein
VHRDLKPGNLIIDRHGHLYIIDLGICKNLQEQTITRGDGLLGTIWWMAPEQVSHPGSEDLRTDVYALGVIFYTVLTGQSPVQGRDAADVAASICFRLPPSPRQIDPAIPADLDRICMKSLAKSPADRFPSGQDLLEALEGRLGSNQPGSPCPACGQPTLAAARFCMACGAATVNSSPGIHCLACGQLVDAMPTCAGCGRSFGTVQHLLRFTKGALTGQVFRIPHGNYRVGRSQLGPRERYISRQQFAVVCSNGHVQVQHAGGVNPTHVAHLPALLPTPLPTGVEITIAGNLAIYEKV